MVTIHSPTKTIQMNTFRKRAVIQQPNMRREVLVTHTDLEELRRFGQKLEYLVVEFVYTGVKTPQYSFELFRTWSF